VRAAGRLLLALVCASGGACATRRETVVPVVDAAHVSLRLDPDGPWEELASASRPWTPTELEAAGERALAVAGAGAGASAPARLAVRGPVASVPPPAPSLPPQERLAVPKARGLSEAAPRGAASARSLEEQARERFLDHPTELKAQQITLYAPPSILAEGRLTGADLSEPTAGRRVAVGAARLVLRELTLTAERITLRAREGTPDIQITARGDVQLVSRQREQVIREEGLKSLILTNDQITPLR
jgi:hypothetical protein